MTSNGGMFDLLKEDRERARNLPISWWNLLALLPVLLAVGFFVQSAWIDSQIAKREQTAIGTIDSRDQSNHNQYSYTFSVKGRQFTGWAYPGNREFSLGQPIVVYYDPLQPSKNSARDFAVINPGGVIFIAVGLFACLFYPSFIYIQRRSRRWAAGTLIDG